MQETRDRGRTGCSRDLCYVIEGGGKKNHFLDLASMVLYVERIEDIEWMVCISLSLCMSEGSSSRAIFLPYLHLTYNLQHITPF